jgi:hypothetical protein
MSESSLGAPCNTSSTGSSAVPSTASEILTTDHYPEIALFENEPCERLLAAA